MGARSISQPPSKIAEEFDKLYRDIPLPTDRIGHALHKSQLPPETIIVSADNHWSPGEDIFFERFPRHLKDRAPRLRKSADGRPQWYIGDDLLLHPITQMAHANFELRPGSSEIGPRMRDLDAEGISQELVFGNAIGSFYSWPDLEVREWVFRAYNQYLSEMQVKAPNRFFGVGLINYWNMSKVQESIAELKELELRTFLLPQTPKAADGAPLNYCSDEMAPLWEAAEAARLPICFHVGEFYKEGPGGVGTTIMTNFGPFRKTLGELVFGGIFDRHPELRIVFVEADLNWIPGALQTASMIFECYNNLIEPKIKRHPREYWRHNCYATFLHDPAGMRLLDVIGADRVMWSSDYPHQESTFGTSSSAIRAVVSAVSQDDARAILGGTARSLFRLN